MKILNIMRLELFLIKQVKVAEVKHYWYNFKCGVKNLITWIPVIWKLRDFDYSYGVDLFIRYIKILRNGISNYQTHENWERDVERIDTFLQMYEALENLYYFEKYEEHLKNENIPRILSKEEVTPEQSKRRYELFLESIQKEERLRGLIWKYLQQHLTSWWD